MGFGVRLSGTDNGGAHHRIAGTHPVDLQALAVMILMDQPLATDLGPKRMVGVAKTTKGLVDTFDQALCLIGTPKGI